MKKVTGLYQENVEMREYYTLNGKEYDVLTDALKVMTPSDRAESRRTIYWPHGNEDNSLGERSYQNMWRTYAGSSLVGMQLTLQTATRETVNTLPLAYRYQGDLASLIFTS